MSTRSNRPRTRSPSRRKLNSRSTQAGMIAPGLELLVAEPAQRLAAGRQPRLLVLARQEAVVRPGRLERREQLVLGHDVAARMAAVELRDRGVERRRRRSSSGAARAGPAGGAVLVLERAGQVVVDRRRTTARAARRRATPRAAGGRLRSARAPARRSSGVSTGCAPAPGRPGRDRQVERLEHERRHAPRPLPAVVGRVRQHELVPGPRHPDVEQPALLLELVVALRAASR